MASRIFVILAISCGVAAFLPRATAQNPALHQVNRIDVSAMGSGSESERFHGFLQDELQRAGFSLGEADADAILSGNFTAEIHPDRQFARVTVLLKSRDGRRTLWSGDFVSEHKGQGQEDVVRSLARTCAEQLRKQWNKG